MRETDATVGGERSIKRRKKVGLEVAEHGAAGARRDLAKKTVDTLENKVTCGETLHFLK
jgi:hypothetical protein